MYSKLSFVSYFNYRYTHTASEQKSAGKTRSPFTMLPWRKQSIMRITEKSRKSLAFLWGGWTARLVTVGTG